LGVKKKPVKYRPVSCSVALLLLSYLHVNGRLARPLHFSDRIYKQTIMTQVCLISFLIYSPPAKLRLQTGTACASLMLAGVLLS
jgi:hypothetical protein